jgi:hypothetical protein
MKTTFAGIIGWFGWINKNCRWIIAILLLLTAFTVISGSAVRLSGKQSKAQPANALPANHVYNDIHLMPAAY